MKMFSLETLLGNFWLESNGKKILFELEDREEWYGKRYSDLEQYNVSTIKSLKSVLTVEEIEIMTELYADPEDAHTVFNSGIDIIMSGLDAIEKA